MTHFKDFQSRVGTGSIEVLDNSSGFVMMVSIPCLIWGSSTHQMLPSSGSDPWSSIWHWPARKVRKACLGKSLLYGEALHNNSNVTWRGWWGSHGHGKDCPTEFFMQRSWARSLLLMVEISWDNVVNSRLAHRITNHVGPPSPPFSQRA